MTSLRLTHALRGITHPNTDLDAQTFLLRVNQAREAAGLSAHFPVSYQPQVSSDEIDDPLTLVWDIGRIYDPACGNFDHHQDHSLGATPIILAQSLDVKITPLDHYVDLADRGFFFKEPQPFPFAETLQGIAGGINLVHARDEERSPIYLDLLTWVERLEVDPFGRFDEALLPNRFHPYLSARREEEAKAKAEASFARWHQTGLGPVAFIESDFVGVMKALYDQGAVLVILYEPRTRMSGWRRWAAKYTVGANPALIAVPERLDLRPLFLELSQLEPSRNPWGGQAGIGGSPREEGGSGLAPEQVVRAVCQYMA